MASYSTHRNNTEAIKEAEQTGRVLYFLYSIVTKNLKFVTDNMMPGECDFVNSIVNSICRVEPCCPYCSGECKVDARLPKRGIEGLRLN